MERVDVNARVGLIGHDVVLLAAIDALGALDRLAQGMSAALIVADHAARHAQLLGADDAILLGDDARARGNVNARSLVLELIEDERVEHCLLYTSRCV